MPNTGLKVNVQGVRGIIRELSLIIIGVPCLFLSAGTLDWIGAKVYILVIFLYQLVYIGILLLLNPQLLNERGKVNWKETKGYDHYFLILYPILSFSALLVAGLEYRFHGITNSVKCLSIGVVLFILSTALALWSYISNSNFILTHRNDKLATQTLCTIGPYRYIRHPGYLSAIISTASFSLISGSWFSSIPVLLNIFLLIIRTWNEDGALQRELNGYAEYSKIVKYRLIPCLW
jgi:protein-S-isoprenylcysteine O-methyltransferase Ste14